MENEKIIVNGLWLGSHLSFLEKLTLNSFTSFNHEFHLWTYEPIYDKIPKGVVVRDGNEILAKDLIFKYPSQMIMGFGGNSYVGFSELFRYKVLYELGGWWSDMDVTCLKPLNEIKEEYFFRNHGILSVVGNIMKVPAKSKLMELCFEKATKEVNDQQDDWHHAIRILCYYIEFLELQGFIRKDTCNLDRLDRIQPYIYKKMELNEIPKSWRFIHWMNSVLDKNYNSESILAKLIEKHSEIIKVM